MIVEETIEKLLQLHLKVMAQSLRELIAESGSAAMSFEDKLALIVDREWTDRQNRKLATRIKQAKLGVSACMEDVFCNPTRGIDKSMVRSFAGCGWVRAKQNIIVIGETGTGKSFLGAALAHAACRAGFRALRTRVPRLLQELAIARADGSYATLLNKLAQVNVLVLDDFLMAPYKDSERRDLLEVLEDRYDKSSTVITTQLFTKTWHQMLEDPTVADAICDRVVHNAHVLSLKGPSIRKTKGLGTATTNSTQSKD
jgi:DNA replication protein DnaC